MLGFSPKIIIYSYKARQLRMSDKNLINLIKETNTIPKEYSPGEFIEGTIVNVDEKFFFLDVGAKTEGLLAKDEIKNTDKDKVTSIGDKLFSTVVTTENKDGYLIMSLKKKEVEFTWAELYRKYELKEVIDVEILEYLKGGFLVDVNGQRGFLPVSHLNRLHFEQFNNAMAAANQEKENFGGLKGEVIKAKIIEIQQEKNRLIVSEKEAVPSQEASHRDKMLAQVNIGDVVECTVSAILPYGVLVDLGGIDGLIHISAIDWAKVDDPSEYFTLGEKIEAKVISKVDDKIALSRKELLENPWNNVEEKYPVGKEITATVSKVVPFGVFLELEAGLDGLIHISELVRPLNQGDEVTAVVVRSDSAERKLALSARQIEETKIYK